MALTSEAYQEPPIEGATQGETSAYVPPFFVSVVVRPNTRLQAASPTCCSWLCSSSCSPEHKATSGFTGVSALLSPPGQTISQNHDHRLDLAGHEMDHDQVPA